MSRQRKTTKTGHLRKLIAHEAAQIMSTEAIRDYYHAKTKAARRLGVTQATELPTNREIELAQEENTRLYRADDSHRQLQTMRESAAQAMEFFRQFNPKLVGGVLNGNVDPHSTINLHLFSDTIEEVIFFLQTQGVPFDQSERMIRFRNQQQSRFPVIQFMAGDDALDLTILPSSTRHQLPLNHVSGNPINRAGFDELQELISLQSA